MSCFFTVYVLVHVCFSYNRHTIDAMTFPGVFLLTKLADRVSYRSLGGDVEVSPQGASGSAVVSVSVVVSLWLLARVVSLSLVIGLVVVTKWCSLVSSGTVVASSCWLVDSSWVLSGLAIPVGPPSLGGSSLVAPSLGGGGGSLVAPSLGGGGGLLVVL